MRLSVGQVVLDRYRVDGLHDQGGMARVYRATHIKLGTNVALKVLTFEHDDELVERFNREARMMARVHHPNVVQILDFGLVGGKLPCIAMEYVDGEPLDMRLVRCGAIPWHEAVELVLGILSGLDAIHAASVLHRDLKPENVIVVPGEVERPKLIDFGIALQEAASDRKLTQVGETVGTPAYMSPEQLYGLPLDARSDVYSTALILYELITEQLPNPNDASEALEMRVSTPLPEPTAPPNRPRVPSTLSEAIFSALEPDPNNRPPTARAFANRLRKVRREARRNLNTNTPITRPPEPAPPPRQTSERRHKSPTPSSTKGSPPEASRKVAWKQPLWARPGSRGQDGSDPPSPPAPRETPSPGKDQGEEVDTSNRLRRGPTTADLQARALRQDSDALAASLETADRSHMERSLSGGLGTVPATPDPSAGAREDASAPAPADTSLLHNQMVVVSLLPRPQLRDPADIHWLQERTRHFGQCTIAGGKFYICSIRASTPEEAERFAVTFQHEVLEHFGPKARVKWAQFTDDWPDLSGSLPPIAEGLMHFLANQS